MPKRWGVIVIALLLSGFLLLGYTLKNAAAPHHLAQLKTQLVEQKSSLTEKFSQVKHILTPKSANEEIHFEFYDTLPNMPVTQAFKQTDASPPPPTTSSSPKPIVITRHQDLEREFAKELAKKQR